LTLEKYLKELADPGKPVQTAELVRLSGLLPEEVELVQGIWPSIPPQRRYQIASQMVELAEDNVDMDFTAFFKLCLKDSNEDVRERAVSGLWESDERALMGIFIKMLQGDESERVRAAAAEALGKFAELAQDDKLLAKDRDRLKEALLQAIRDLHQPLEVRRRAVEAIAPFNHAEVKALVEEAYHSHEPKMRYSAVYAMGRSADPQWLSVIVKELTSDDGAMRYEAASASGTLGEDVAVPHLLPILRDDDVEVRQAAVRALGAIGGPRARNALLGCLKSSDEILREAARDALEYLEMNEDPLSFKYRI
jgi:HEAT repeat protein